MKKIKHFIIHLLGGFTEDDVQQLEQESKESDYNSFCIGYYNALTRIVNYINIETNPCRMRKVEQYIKNELQHFINVHSHGTQN